MWMQAIWISFLLTDCSSIKLAVSINLICQVWKLYCWFQVSETLKPLFPLFLFFVSQFSEMCTTFPFTASKIGQFPLSAKFDPQKFQTQQSKQHKIFMAFILDVENNSLKQGSSSNKIKLPWCIYIVQRINMATLGWTVAGPFE